MNDSDVYIRAAPLRLGVHHINQWRQTFENLIFANVLKLLSTHQIDFRLWTVRRKNQRYALLNLSEQYYI